ncbi:hypothetical protein M406DRAFT_30489, partial [Cryphonectria parasitica EP155]
WQNKLAGICSKYGVSTPQFSIFSDKRGQRTAWTSFVIIANCSFPARFWYDGKFLNNAREDAAEVA